MERLTLDKSVSEMSMVELVHNSCYIKNGNARYRDYESDVDARALTRQLLKNHAAGDDAFTCDEAFDEWMVDCLQYGMDDKEGLIALFYRNLWAMAELRECLKTYEDTGLTPDQIKEMERLYAEKCTESPAGDFGNESEEESTENPEAIGKAQNETTEAVSNPAEEESAEKPEDERLRVEQVERIKKEIEKRLQAYKDMPWIKAIVVYISYPEE